jgi:2-succinyl-5-enolpyruvyl-6-hydroxy-3-cyclohexene-1-carboxylate synthase
MAIDFRNTNSIWASILSETLKHLGLSTAVICPGSRSTPLAVAFAQQLPDIEAISILDERSAAFFALGRAKATGRPTALVCTSGSAGANFYPAVIEAKESRIPLLILTADRPPELRDCHSGQTIDQVKLYGTYPNWQAELATPSLEMGMLSYLRQIVIHAWERSHYPVPGPVHLNIPFRDPLAPLTDGSALPSSFDVEEFFTAITTTPLLITHYPSPITYYQTWQQYQRGIIIAGVSQPQQPQEYCRAIALLSLALQFPVLAEGLSPLRNYADINPYLISTYDLILRNPQLAKNLAPEIVIHLGEMPTSKELRNWINITQPQRWIIDNSDQNLDPLHGKTTHLRMSIEQLIPIVKDSQGRQGGELPLPNYPLPITYSPSLNEYLQMWCSAEAKVRTAVDEKMASMNDFFEGKAAWLLSQTLPQGTPLFIANSMPVRDVEFFFAPNNLHIQPFFNRGANGIDGTLSTALGIAHSHQSTVMLTGDLALLHDTNGFLIRNKFSGHLTILLINNNGGGIFEMLPISKFEPPFEEFFATPQDIDFAQLCATYGVEHELISSWSQLQAKLNPLPTQGIRVLELRTNRKIDSQWRRDNLPKFAAG